MNDLRAHLDHLIKRQSIRYISPPSDTVGQFPNEEEGDRSLRYNDLVRADGWVTQIRKPDFQRETNAWTAKDCVDFLDTAVFGKIIPSIILWMSHENGFVYVLDGAHRLSVLRAWMIDDWGDKAGDYYQRRDMDQIRAAANEVRSLVRMRIGLFSDFKAAHIEFSRIVDEGKAPKAEMAEKRFRQANFYNRVSAGLMTLSVQWEKGNYDSAEQSFLRINRSGQALDPWEATLIEYRNSSYARCIMSIANGGESGHYWPEPAKNSDPCLLEEIAAFGPRSARIYRRLFVPPYRTPIADLNVPFMIAPEYFQKHKYLLEVLPLITEQVIAISDDRQIDRLKKDSDKPAEVVIPNAAELLTLIENNLDHMISDGHSSKSLSLVPLFYWYSFNGKFIRALFYGFVYWLLFGKEETIKNRKLVLSVNRDRFETVLFEYKTVIAPSLQLKAGAGLKAVGKVADFFQALLNLLNENIGKTTEDLEDQIVDLISNKGFLYGKKSSAKKGRLYSKQDKSTINIREMFGNSIRCHICGGVVNLHHNLQYDHLYDYSVTQVTDPDTGKPTHPFCNNMKKTILQGREGHAKYQLPSLTIDQNTFKQPTVQQLKFWGDDAFPV